MELSIIIVNWNSTKLLTDLLFDINRCTQGIESEVIVIDNASEDFSKNDLLEQIQKLTDKSYSLTIIENKENLGFAKAANQALKIAKGKFVLFSNPDIRLNNEDTIRALLNSIKKHQEFGILGAQLLKEDGRLQNSSSNFPNLLGEIFGRSILNLLFPDKFPAKLKQNIKEIVEVPAIIGAFFIARKELIDTLGGFDEDYFLFLEETDLCFRAGKNRYKIGIMPTIQVYHLQAQSRKKAFYRSFTEYFISLSLFYKKHYSKYAYTLFKLIRFVKCLFNTVLFLLLSLSTGFALRKPQMRLKINLYLLGWNILKFKKLRIKGNS